MEFRFIEKSAKTLENFNLDEGILVVSKLLRGKIVIFPIKYHYINKLNN